MDGGAIDGGSLCGPFIGGTRTYADRMKAMGPSGGPVDIAIGLRYGGRYDGRDGPGPARRKSKNGTGRPGG